MGSKKGWLFVLPFRAVYSFSNPGMLVVYRLSISLSVLFSEPQNSGGALAPPTPPLSTALPLTGLCCKKTSCLIEKNNSRNLYQLVYSTNVSLVQDLILNPTRINLLIYVSFFLFIRIYRVQNCVK